MISEQGLARADRPVRVPADPDRGMDARLCAPVWCDWHLYGYLWLVGSEEDLPDSSLGVVEATAAAAGEMLQAAQLAMDNLAT